MTGGEKPSFGFEIGDLGLSWIRNILVDLFWVERSWQDFFLGLVRKKPTSGFSILC